MDLDGVNMFFFGRVTADNEEALVFVNVGALPALFPPSAIHMDRTFNSPPRVELRPGGQNFG